MQLSLAISDTIGAGDAFAASSIYGLLEEQELEKYGRLGDIVAQFSINKLGTRQGFSTSTELAQHYQEFYQAQSDLFLSSLGFLPRLRGIFLWFTQNLVNNAILYRLLGVKIEITVGIMYYLFQRLPGMSHQDVAKYVLKPHNFAGSDFNISGLPMSATSRLVQVDCSIR